MLLENPDGPPEHWFLGDILHLDETPWECCPRSFLKRALTTLEAETSGSSSPSNTSST